MTPKSADPGNFNPQSYQKELVAIFKTLETSAISGKKNILTPLLSKFPKDGRNYFSKSELLAGYRQFAGTGGLNPFNLKLARQFTRKPMRTLSGVTPITVLTRPYPCPGECLFCPNDTRMPKSYIASEPGAQRAAVNLFDPYLQTFNRLLALVSMGHPVDKAELLVLGGTWSVYPQNYQIWFIKRLFDALNDFSLGQDHRSSVIPGFKPVTQTGALIPGKNYNQSLKELYGSSLITLKESATYQELETAHRVNETSSVRCVGLVLETRPDFVTPRELIHWRRLGVTKIQLGVQSLNDRVLKLNRRGHTVDATRQAIALLRLGGFKIHLHWMPNLYGSSPQEDQVDFDRLFNDPGILPDELKIYPCSLIPGTGLVHLYKSKKWRPYTYQELLRVVSYCLTHTPRYCRITRLVRDIPSQEILAGNKKTNFRQLAEATVTQKEKLKDIRSREVKASGVTKKSLKFKITTYQSRLTTEKFLEFVTPADRITAFLRLSLPKSLRSGFVIPELNNSALIREVHVYGQATEIGHLSRGAQHLGLGKKLIHQALSLSSASGFTDVAVISAIGTREYYRKLGFTDGALYQHHKC